MEQEPRGWYNRLSRPLQRMVNYAAVLATLCLLAVLFPVWCSLREAPRASCLSNEKQIVTGLLMYAQDFDEQFPCGSRINRRDIADVKDTPQEKNLHTGQGWAGEIYPYTKNAQIFACAEVVRQDSRAGAPIVSNEGREAQLWTVSYAYNRNVALNTALAEKNNPARTVLLSEVAGARANVTHDHEYNPENVYSPAGNGISILAATDGGTGFQASSTVRYATGIPSGYAAAQNYLFRWKDTGEMIAPRHNKGANYAMADGHVKHLEPGVVSAGDNAVAATSKQNNAQRRAAGTGNLGVFSITYSTK